jgi:flagellar biosynthesis component FlhA
MKMIARVMLLLLIGGGLTLSACETEDGKKAEDEKAKTEEPAEEEKADEEEAEPEEEAEEEEEAETEVDRDNYIEAAYQVACVEKVIEDVEKRKTIKTEITFSTHAT